jgi:predicted CoA-binding protein
MTPFTSALRDAATIAVVGLSDRRVRTSYAIASYLQDVGYRIIPVNPHAAKRGDPILCERPYADLHEIPSDVRIDIVNVFRQPRFTEGVVRDVMERSGRTGHTPLVWTQLGVSSKEAEALAIVGEVPYVRNRCIMVEHRAVV